MTTDVNSCQPFQALFFYKEEELLENSGSSETPGSMDNDPAFIQLVDAAWQAIQNEQANPDAANTELVMQDVNAISAYFTKNGIPTQADNPEAFAVYSALGSATSPYSLAGMCATYGTANEGDAMKALESNPSLLTGVYNALNAFGSVYKDSSNQTIETDIDNLQGALQLYNWYMQQTHKDPGELDSLLKQIAVDIQKLDTDAKTAGLSDGYLTNITTLLNQPITPGSSDTLASLAAIVAGGGSITAFQNALNQIGENSGNSGGDLQKLLSYAIQKEYGG